MAVTERRGKKGSSWRVTYRDQSGKQHSGGTFRTRKQAQHEYGALMSEVAKGRSPWIKGVDLYLDTWKGRGTVAAYAEAWLPGHSLSPHSREAYRNTLDRHILPALGNMALGEVSPADVRAWFRKTEAAGASGALMAKIKTVASAMFQTAFEDGKIALNPVRGVKVKKDAPRRRKAFTLEEYRRFLLCVPGHYRLLVRTLVESGMRFEEAIGLKAEDIEGQTIHVTRTLLQLGSPRRFEVKDHTKNGKSRDIKVSQGLADELSAGTGWVFLTPKGGHISRDWRTQVWMPAMKAAGLDGTGLAPRDLRRTHATWIRQSGASLETVRDRLGHGNVYTTDRYLAEDKSSQDQALDAFQAAMCG